MKLSTRIIAWGSVPLWAVRRGIRQVKLQTTTLETIPGAGLMVIVDWANTFDG